MEEKKINESFFEIEKGKGLIYVKEKSSHGLFHLYQSKMYNKEMFVNVY